MSGVSGLYVKTDNLKQVMDSINWLVACDVLVGYPDSGEARKPEELPSTFTAKGKRVRHFNTMPPEVTNAYIAFVMEYGSPRANIPARPFMIPGIRAIRDRIESMLRRAAILALQGEQQKARVVLNQLGLIAVASLQRAITIGEGWPALSQRTLAARLARGVTRTHPLIDTGQLRQHVTYVLRKSGKKRLNVLNDYMTLFKRA